MAIAANLRKSATEPASAAIAQVGLEVNFALAVTEAVRKSGIALRDAGSLNTGDGAVWGGRASIAA